MDRSGRSRLEERRTGRGTPRPGKTHDSFCLTNRRSDVTVFQNMAASRLARLVGSGDLEFFAIRAKQKWSQAIENKQFMLRRGRKA